MRVRDLMIEKVLTIGPEAPIKDVAKILVEHRISGLPVCDIEGRVLGVVSEGDILYKEHDPTEGHTAGPLGWIVDGSPNYLGAVKAKALTAATAMTTPAVTVAPYESVAEAARLMCERRVNRLPVVKDDKLIGIVTRADLVRAFTRGDEEIERKIEDDVLGRTLRIEKGRVEVAVSRGTVRLEGVLHTLSDTELLERLVGRVPWQVDDRSRKGRRALEEAAR